MPHLTQRDAAKLMHRGAIALARIESNGLRIDVPYLEQAIKDTKKSIARETAALESTDEWRLWVRRFGSKAKMRSRAQLAVVLKELGHIKGDKRTKTGRDSVDQSALDDVDTPFVKSYLQLEQLHKLDSTYLQGLRREVFDGYLGPFFNLHTTETFRSSSSEINFQNIPIRNPTIGKTIRRAFIPRDGHVLVEVDYVGIEVRVSCCYNQDPRLISYVKDKSRDMHRDMAMQIFKLKCEQVSKVARYCAKNMFVFPQFYGDWYKSNAVQLWQAVDRLKVSVEGGGSLRDHLKSVGLSRLGECDWNSEPKAGTFEHHLKGVEHDFWNRRFSVYTQWKEDWYQAYRRLGSFQLLTGFVIEGLFNRKQVINYPVQGAAFHCLLWSLIELQREIDSRRWKSKLVGQIHDSLVADVHVEELDKYLQLVRDVMTNRLPEVWKWLIVPLEIEAEVAAVSWADKKPVDLTI
jgi:DNA polymerase-1